MKKESKQSNNGNISPYAIIASGVQLGKNVTIGPFCVLEGDIVIGDNTVIYPYVHIHGPVKIGSDNQIFDHVTIGLSGQHREPYSKDHQQIIIGNNNIFRENVTIHAPIFYEDESISSHTTVGDNCFLMVNSHISHNTFLGNHVVFANGVLPAGCCEFHDHSFVSGNVLIHQFVRVGAHAFLSGGSRVGRDIPPFMLVSSFFGLIVGVNIVGIRRSNFPTKERTVVKEMFKIFKEANALSLAKDRIFEKYSYDKYDVVKITLDFLENCKRGISEFGDAQNAKDSILM